MSNASSLLQASAMEEISMTNLVNYTRSGPISRIVMDDGKVNVRHHIWIPRP